MSKTTGRYKWDGKCPDCKADVQIEKFGDNRAKYNRVEIDCPKCSYRATGYVRSSKKMSWISDFYKSPKQYIWSETISPLEHVSRDMKWWAERINWLSMKVSMNQFDKEFFETLEWLEKMIDARKMEVIE